MSAPDSRPGPSRGRLILFVSVTALMTLVAVEIVLQLGYFVTAGDFLYRRVGVPIYASDPVRCYRVASDLRFEHGSNEFRTVIHTNSIGLRTGPDHHEYAEPKPSDVYRILVLGPSFAFGWGADYEEIFPTLLEQSLDGGDKRIEVMNLGTPAQGVEAQLCWVAQVAPRYQPDMILQISYGRSVPAIATGCPADLECPIVEDGLVYRTSPTLARRAVGFVKNSAIVFYSYYVFQSLLPVEKVEDVGKELHTSSEPAVDPEDLDRLTRRYDAYVEYVRGILGPDLDVAFLFIPYSFVVHPEDESRWAHLRGADSLLMRTQIEEQMAALEGRGVPMINTLPALLAKADDERLYYWLDIHFTPAGNEVVAEAARAPLQSMIDQRLGVRPAR